MRVALNFINTSTNAVYLILAVMLFRLIFTKAPKYIRTYIWALVGLRLTFPFEIESKLSLIPSNTVLPYSVNYPESESVSDTVNTVVLENTENTLNVSFNYFWIWFTVFALLLIYAFVSFLILKNKTSDAVKTTDGIYLSDRIPSPFVFGIFRAKIYINSSLDANDREYVIAHEKAHLKRFDHITKPFAFLLVTVYWFNPFVWIAYFLFCRDIELATDERVIKERGEEWKVPYSTALVNASISRSYISACPVAFGESNVKQRIKAVLNYKKPSFWIIAICGAFIAGVAVFFLTSPIKNNFDYIEDKDYILNADIYTPVYSSGEYQVIPMYEYSQYILNADKVLTPTRTSGIPDGKVLVEKSADTEYIERLFFSGSWRESDAEEFAKNVRSWYLSTDGTVALFETKEADLYYCIIQDKRAVFLFTCQKEEATFPTFERVYSFKSSDDVMEPRILISMDDCKFQFIYSGFSSFVPYGSYTLKDGVLTLTCDSSGKEYVFKETEAGYVFDESASSAIPRYRVSGESSLTYTPVPDGALFENDTITNFYISTKEK